MALREAEVHFSLSPCGYWRDSPDCGFKERLKTQQVPRGLGDGQEQLWVQGLIPTKCVRSGELKELGESGVKERRAG